jgi:hypothetical protein
MLWTLVVVGPPYLLWAIGAKAGSGLNVGYHPIASTVIKVYFAVVLIPGMMLEFLRAMAFSPLGVNNMFDGSPVIPLGSLVFWFTVLFLIFRWRQRFATQKAKESFQG